MKNEAGTALCIQASRARTLFVVLTALAMLLLSSIDRASAGLPHTWTGDPTNPYGLTDLDHFSDAYDYCKWGNVMDSGYQGQNLTYTPLTQWPWSKANTDLFLNDGTTVLNPISPPSLWLWSGLFRTVDVISLSQLPFAHNYTLFRYLHFKDTLVDEMTNRVLGSDTSKIIVVIHGWNPTSDDDPFSGDFVELRDALKNKLAGSEWKLVFYNWKEDSDTGSQLNLSPPFAHLENPTRSAEIAHLHGQHLGELITKIAPNGALQKVHFITHSAGAWAARAATRYIVANTYAKTQLTLLDPFMPSRLVGTDTALSESVMGQLPLLDGNNSGQLVLLENYYAIDDQVWTEGHFSYSQWDKGSDVGYNATSADFTSAWRSKDVNQRVDWQYDPTNTYAWHYKRHSGPVQFYADTVLDTKFSIDSKLKANALHSFPSNIGWQRSMFYQEPQVTPQPSFSSSAYSTGATPTLSSGARKRGENSSSGITFQWQKTVGSGWNNIATATGPNYTLPSVTAAVDGTQYRLVVNNDAGTDVSNVVTLHVGVAGGTVPARPTVLTATGVSSSQINLSWNDNSNNETQFRIQRRTGSELYSTIGTAPASNGAKGAFFDTIGLVQGVTYYYQVIADGTLPSDASNEASAATLQTTGVTRVLTVNSVNPGSGAYIYVIPNDANGQADGNASFSRQYTSALTATVVATVNWNGSVFQKWRKDGVDVISSNVLNVVMDVSHTMTAVYATPVVTGYSITTTRSPLAGGTSTGDGTYASGANVTITATPVSGYHFLNWTVNTSGQNGGTVFNTNSTWSFPASGNLSLVANFVQDAPALSISATASPAAGGSATGTGTYPSGQSVTFTATANPGWEFGTWTDENGTIVSFLSSFPVSIGQSRSYTANFNPILAQSYTLAITAVNGTAFKTPNQVAYTPGSTVRIDATPATGYQFTGWSGDASGTQTPITVTMDRSKAVTANFAAVPPSTYTVTLPVRTGGTVTKSPNLSFYSQGSVVTLTPTANSGYSFSGWRFDAYGNANPFQLTMDQNKTPVADFVQNSPSSAVVEISVPFSVSVPWQGLSVQKLVKNPGSGLMYWSAYATVPWIRFTTNGGMIPGGNGSDNPLNFVCDENPLTVSRTAEIRVNAPGATNNPQIYTITQDAGVPHFALNVASNNGTVAKSPDQTSYATGTQVTLTATPISGYQFTGWSGDITGSQPSATVTMDGNKNITANFQIIPNPDLYATASIQQGTAYVGTPYVLTGTIGNRGVGTTQPFKVYCVFSPSNLTPPGVEIYGTTTPVSFSGLNAGTPSALNATVTVPSNLGQQNCYLWILVDPEGSSGETAANTVNNNVVLPFNVFPTPAASGPDITLNDFVASSGGALPGASVTVSGRLSNYGTASAQAFNYYVSISTSSSVPPDKNALNASGSVPSLPVAADFSVQKTVTLPNNLSAGNYYLWILADPEGSDGEPTANRSNNSAVLPLTIYQPIQSFTVTATPSLGAGGTVTGAGIYSAGALVPLFATPNIGYAFVNWMENGVPVSSIDGYNFTANANRVLVANIVPAYTLTPSAGANGTISPSAVQTVTSGGSAAFTGTPNTGYAVNQWLVNGTPVQTGGTGYMASNVAGSASVQVTFKLLTFTVTPSAGANGSISPSTAQTVNSGGSVGFTATPNSGYTVNQWLVNSVAVQTGGSGYTVNSVTANAAVQVTFKPITYTVTPSPGGNGSISPNTVQTVNSGSNLNFSATPNSGYSVSQWSVDGSVVQTGGGSYTLNNVTANHSLSVTFAALSSNADLASLTVSAGTLSPAFASGTITYTDSVSNATTLITVTPTLADSTATVKINGNTVASGSASGGIALALGANPPVSIVVTAEDGTPKTYTLTVTRQHSTAPWPMAQVTTTANAAAGSATGVAHSSSYLYYYKGTDNQIWCVYWTGAAWAQAALTTTANVDDWLASYPAWNIVYYKGTDNHLWAVYYSGGWKQVKLSGTANVAGDLALNAGWNVVFYRGTDNKVWVMYWSGSAWVQVSLGGTANVAGSLAVDAASQLVYYRGSDNQMWCYYVSGGVWRQGQLSTTANVGGSVTQDSGLRAYYRSTVDNSAWALNWNGSAWVQDLLDSTASLAGPTSLYTTKFLAYLNTAGQCEALYATGTIWQSALLGTGGSGLTGGLATIPAAHCIFARRNDGQIVLFYY